MGRGSSARVPESELQPGQCVFVLELFSGSPSAHLCVLMEGRARGRVHTAVLAVGGSRVCPPRVSLVPHASGTPCPALQEEMAELKAQLYLLEKEKAALELKLSTREAQEQAYLVHIEHLKAEVEEHREQHSRSLSSGGSGKDKPPKVGARTPQGIGQSSQAVCVDKPPAHHPRGGSVPLAGTAHTGEGRPSHSAKGGFS